MSVTINPKETWKHRDCYLYLECRGTGQWQSLEAETLEKSLSNGCEREKFLCIKNIFVPIKTFAVSKQGEESEIHSQILKYFGLMSIVYRYFFLII